MKGKKKILIVEDQVITSMTLKENLVFLGYNVIGVESTGELAIKNLSKHSPDLILMDIYLKGKMTGVEAAKKISQSYNIPIVYLTASTNEKVFQDAKNEGIYGFIIKPFDVQELKISIEIALYKHEIDQKTKKDKCLLDLAQKISNVGHWELNCITNELKWSDEIYRIFELNPDEFEATYEAFLNAIHPEDRDYVNKSYVKSLGNKTAYAIEHRLLMKDGRIKYVKESCETSFNEDGYPVSSIGTVQDITTQKFSELELKESENNFRQLFLNSIDEVYLVEFGSFNFINTNSTASDELGYSEEELLKLKAPDIIADDGTGQLAQVNENLIKLNLKNSYQVIGKHKRKDGTTYPVDIRFKRIKYMGKEIILAQARNITVRLELEKKKNEERKVRDVLNKLLSITLEDKDVKTFLDEALNLIVSLPYFRKLGKAAIFTAKDHNTLELVSELNFEEELLASCKLVEKGNCLCGKTFESGEARHLSCGDKEYQVSINNKSEIGNYNVPILYESEKLGVLSVYLICGHQKDDNEIEVLRTIANTIGIILIRKKNQEALKNSENRFRELTETIKEAFWLMDWKTKKLLYISPSYEELYEHSCESLYENPLSWSDFIHPEDKERVLTEYVNSIDGNYNTEFRLLFFDGRVKWIHERAFPILGDDEVVRMAGYSVDITERKMVEEELKLSEEKFRTYVENSADVITITNENFEIVYNSPNNISVFGYKQDENIGVVGTELIHPEDVDRFKDAFSKFQKRKNKSNNKSFEYRYKHKKEGWKWIESGIKYVDDENQAPYFIINSRDISERKEMESELIGSELRYRSLFENNLSGIYRIDLDMVVLECNDAFANIIGYESKDQVIGKSKYELYHSENEDEIFDIINKKNGKLKSFENFIVLKNNDGKRVRVLENTSLIKSAVGKPIYYEGSIIDTTSLLELEKERKAFEIIPAENPNPVLRVDYELKIMYANEPGKKLLDLIGNQDFLLNSRIIDSVIDIIHAKTNRKEFEFELGGKNYLLFVANIQQYEYVNIYAADITELKKTQADYLKLSLELEKLVEKRTIELNSTVKSLNKEIVEKQGVEKKMKSSLQEKEVLLNEITHRVKNNLQVVASLLSLQKANIKNKESIQLLSDTGHRIKSMALIHETLYKSSDFSQINIKSYIESLVSYIFNSFDTSLVKINLDIQDFNLTIDTATSLGMIVMELITNSLKYAFTEEAKGVVELNLNKLEKEFYELIISDNGKGYPDEIDYSSTKSLGMQLVNGLTSQLQGEIKMIAGEGTCFKIIFKDTKKHKYEKS